VRPTTPNISTLIAPKKKKKKKKGRKRRGRKGGRGATARPSNRFLEYDTVSPKFSEFHRTRCAPGKREGKKKRRPQRSRCNAMTLGGSSFCARLRGGKKKKGGGKKEEKRERTTRCWAYSGNSSTINPPRTRAFPHGAQGGKKKKKKGEKGKKKGRRNPGLSGPERGQRFQLPSSYVKKGGGEEEKERGKRGGRKEKGYPLSIHLRQKHAGHT